MSLLEYNIMKARHGRYADTAENRRLHRVGQEYGHAAKEDPEAAKKTPRGEEEGKEKRTYDTARKELSTVLSNKEEFIKKYGQDEFDKRVGALVGEARELRDTEHKAEADKDFEAAKQPPKPKDTRSKKEIRTERLEKYKEQLKKIQDKMNQEGESEESRKMGEALEAKWKAKIEKLEAKVNRGKKKEADSPSEKNKKEFEARVEQAYKDGKISKDAYDAYKKDLGSDIFKKEKEFVDSGKSSQDFWDEMNSDLDKKIEGGGKELSPTEKKVLDLLSHSSSKYNDISKVEVYETAAGNWELVYDGKEVSVVGGDQLDHDELMEAGLLTIDDDREQVLEEAQEKVRKELDEFAKWTEEDWSDADKFEEMEDRTERLASLIKEYDITKEEWNEIIEPYAGGNISYDYENFVQDDGSSKGAEMIDESVDDPVTGKRVDRSAYVGTPAEVSKIDEKDLEKGLSGQVFELRTKGLQINFINTNGDGTSYKVGEWEGGEKAGWDGGGKPKRDVFGKGGARATRFQYSKEYNDTEISKYGSKGYDADRGIFRYKTKEEMIEGIKAYIQDVFKTEK